MAINSYFIYWSFGFLGPRIALMGILKRKFNCNEKIIWILVVIFFNIIKSILYNW